jgi:chaperone required for assembly of F1-ATPase
MREFLEEAEAHRKDAYRDAQKHAGRELPRRFYKEVGVAPVNGGFAVTLDGKTPLTPGRVPVIVPVAAIATAMAAEWSAQAETIDPMTMPLVRLINSAVESGEDKVEALRDEIVKYAANDLLLYRADGPAALIAAQERHWDDALVRLARHFEVSFQPTIGIVHQPQPDHTLAKLAAALRDEGLFVLTALNSITSITGSGLLAIALWHKLLDAEQVWAAAHVDEDFQQSQWGEVHEAVERKTKRRAEYDAAVRVLDALRT